MKLYFSILTILLTVIGCKNDSEGDFAFFGGEIINPKNNYVVLSKSDIVLDTIKLDGNNRFIYKIKELETGLYTFHHGGEIQMALLEPSDSIMVRLNTLDFDESLVYTGEGAKKNNYFINEFLHNEKEKKDIYKFCQLNPENYAKFIDSLKGKKEKKLEKFNNKFTPSSLFMKIAEANIEYNYYHKKEIYPFVHYGNNKIKILDSLPKDFYDYRQAINYNDDFLKDYENYNTFLISNFNNLALTTHYNHSNNEHFKWSAVCYNLDRLKLIDSLVTNTSTKEYLLNDCVINYITKNRSIESNNILANYYLSISNNDTGKKRVSNLINSLNKLVPTSNLPVTTLLDYNNSEIDLSTLINQPTVVFFWSHNFNRHFKESHLKIEKLKTKYPEVKFIGININSYPLKTSRNFLKNNRFSLKNEYQFKDSKKSTEELTIYHLTKTFILDKNKKIVTSNANIFSKNFEEELLGMLNK